MSSWPEQLAQELDNLTATLTISGAETAVPVENFRLLIDRFGGFSHATHDRVETVLAVAEIKDTSTIVELLLEHPSIKDNLDNGGRRFPSLYLCIPNGYSHAPLSELAKSLFKNSIATSGTETVKLLLRYLSLGETSQLPIYEVTYLNGLASTQEFQIFPGLDIVSYEEAIKRGLLVHVDGRASTKSKYSSDTIQPLCLVRSGKFGPSIVSSDAIDEQDVMVSTIKFDWGEDDDISDILTFLPLASNSGLDILGRSFSIPEFRVFNSHFSPRPLPNRRARNLWQERNELTREVIEKLRMMFEQFKTFKSSDKPRLALAARRLGSALSRNEGSFRAEDSILDVTIALEIMYSITSGGEIQNKMATRLAHFLGVDPVERYRLFGSVKSLYSRRSAITHGRKPRTDHLATLDTALNLARNTFDRLLERQQLPSDEEWAKISVGYF